MTAASARQRDVFKRIFLTQYSNGVDWASLASQLEHSPVYGDVHIRMNAGNAIRQVHSVRRGRVPLPDLWWRVSATNDGGYFWTDGVAYAAAVGLRLHGAAGRLFVAEGLDTEDVRAVARMHHTPFKRAGVTPHELFVPATALTGRPASHPEFDAILKLHA